MTRRPHRLLAVAGLTAVVWASPAGALRPTAPVVPVPLTPRSSASPTTSVASSASPATATGDLDGVATEQRARAERVLAEIERLEERSLQLGEEYDQQLIAAAEAEASVAVAAARLEGLQGEVDRLERKVSGFALRAYIHAGTVDGIGSALAGGALVAGEAPRRVYGAVVLGIDLSAADDLSEARRATEGVGVQMAAAEQHARLAGQRAESQRRAVEAVADDLRRVHAGLEAEIAAAVEAERQRREALQLEAARRAIEEARQAAAAAAAAATTVPARPAPPKVTTTTAGPPPVRATTPPTTTRATAAPATTRVTSPPTTAAPPTTRVTSPPATVAPATTTAPPTTPAPTVAPTAPSVTPAPTTRPASTTVAPAETTTTAYRPPPPSSPNADIAVQAALSQVGVPYQFAASEPGVGFDCSGLTMWAWAQAGVSLPHSSALQARRLPSVSLADIAPGDLVFTHDPISHVSVYVGGGRVVHAPNSGGVVSVSAMRVDRVTAIGRPG